MFPIIIYNKKEGISKHYNGKYKHSVYKVQIIANLATKEIISTSIHDGRRSDNAIFKETQKKYKTYKVIFIADKAYIGINNVITAIKKYKKTKFTQIKKEFNKIINSYRCHIEHLIARIKNNTCFEGFFRCGKSLLERCLAFHLDFIAFDMKISKC